MITHEESTPTALIICETSEYAYSSHGHLFREDELSATRHMKRQLLENMDIFVMDIISLQIIIVYCCFIRRKSTTK